MDFTLQKKAQERHRGSPDEEKNAKDPEVQQSLHWRHFRSDYAEEKPDFRSQEGTKGTGYSVHVLKKMDVC